MADLTQLAANAGFTGSDLGTAVAIAMAESGGNPSKYNSEPTARGGTPAGKGSYGLWQIYLKKHPEFEGWDLLDPQVNAHAAYEVYSREGFNAWTTYKTRKYLAFVPSMPAPGPESPVLTLDAATGLPVSDAMLPTPLEASILPTEGLSFGNVLLWGAIGLFALWIFEEAL